MVRVQGIKFNPNCVASITVRITKGNSSMQIGQKKFKIQSILHHPSGK